MLRLLTVCLLIISCVSAYADETSWSLSTSIYTTHFNPKPVHNNDQGLVGLVRTDADQTLWGAAAFTNSFDQQSWFLFHGKRFEHPSLPLFATVLGGAIHGYRGKYQDKIPLNHVGVAPVIIPTAGFRLGPVQSELVLLGANAMMVNIGWDL